MNHEEKGMKMANVTKKCKFDEWIANTTNIYRAYCEYMYIPNITAKVLLT